jgi:transcriptional regulator GlxA family with amidase domain
VEKWHVSETVPETQSFCQERDRQVVLNAGLSAAPKFVCRDHRVERVLRVVARDLTRRVTLPEAAVVACLEPFYFSKRFRKSVGLSFTDWNTLIRIAEAKRLLTVVDLSITKVAAAVGYKDLTTFERTFRRSSGECPREYRRRLVEANSK